MSGTDLIGRLLIHEGLSLLNQMHGTIIEKLKIVAGEIDVLPPVATKPLHILLNAINILLLFPGRIGIIKP